MKIAEGFKLRTMLGENIITREGPEAVNFNKMVSLNATAAYLWKAVEGKEFTVEDLRDLLLEEYEVDEETAMKDAGKLVESWLKVGLVTE